MSEGSEKDGKSGAGFIRLKEVIYARDVIYALPQAAASFRAPARVARRPRNDALRIAERAVISVASNVI
jgi:hypothetical protein